MNHIIYKVYLSIIDFFLIFVRFIGRMQSNRINAELLFFKRKVYTAFISPRLGRIGHNTILCGDLQLNEASCIAIGDSTKICRCCVLTAWNSNVDPSPHNTICPSTHLQSPVCTSSPKISIGKNCNIGEYNHITAINSILIGNNVLTGRWVTITDNSHGTTNIKDLTISPTDRKVVSKGKVVIGDKVWIGDKVTILPGVTIGSGCVVAANSVVTQSFPENSIIGGIPAKLLKRSL